MALRPLTDAEFFDVLWLENVYDDKEQISVNLFTEVRDK